MEILNKIVIIIGNRSTATGPSGIPHSSYAHSSQNYNSDNPYGNRTSNYSYNI